MKSIDTSPVSNTLSIAPEVDALTGLCTYRPFMRVLEEAVGRAYADGSLLSLLYVDLDQFKHFNDMRGHEAGDKALYELARLLVNAARPSDISARLGGDEFVVLLPHTDLPTAVTYAETLRQTVQETFSVRPEATGLTATIGVATNPPNDDWTALNLLSMADARQCVAKKNLRRNQVSARTLPSCWDWPPNHGAWPSLD
jgi:diguanylate cyclase (GGDEF)-like protein